MRNRISSRISRSFVLVTSLILCVPAVMANSVPMEIGLVDMQKIILEVQEGKQAIANLKQEIEAKKAELGEQKQEIDDLDKSLRSNQDLLSSEAKLNKQREIQEKFAKLQEAEMGFQSEIKKKEFDATQKIAAKAARIATKLAEEAKLTMVYERNSAGLIYVANSKDITQDVIDVYEKEAKTKFSKK